MNQFTVDILQGVYQHNPTIPLVYYPDGKRADSKSASFPLEPLLSKSFHGEKSGYAWTYFIVDTRTHVEGLNAHIQLVSNTKLNYEIYVRYGGIPTIDMWDISYSNQIAKAKNSSVVKLYDSSKKRVNMYILYAKDEYWIIGIRHSVSVGSTSRLNTTMTVALKWCPERCSDRGIYKARQDASGSISYQLVTSKLLTYRCYEIASFLLEQALDQIQLKQKTYMIFGLLKW